MWMAKDLFGNGDEDEDRVGVGNVVEIEDEHEDAHVDEERGGEVEDEGGDEDEELCNNIV